MRGDIILFKSAGTLTDRFVTHFTHGPFVHVAVDCGDGTNIAAHPKGITRDTNPTDESTFVLVPTTRNAEAHSFHDAFYYLERQIGKRYGWLNILDQAVGVLGLPIYFFEREHNDCSTLVAKYLCRLNPDYCFDNPDLISPNDIARFFKII